MRAIHFSSGLKENFRISLHFAFEQRRIFGKTRRILIIIFSVVNEGLYEYSPNELPKNKMRNT
jgi:hypothetical protein